MNAVRTLFVILSHIYFYIILLPFQPLKMPARGLSFEKPKPRREREQFSTKPRTAASRKWVESLGPKRREYLRIIKCISARKTRSIRKLHATPGWLVMSPEEHDRREAAEVAKAEKWGAVQRETAEVRWLANSSMREDMEGNKDVVMDDLSIVEGDVDREKDGEDMLMGESATFWAGELELDVEDGEEDQREEDVDSDGEIGHEEWGATVYAFDELLEAQAKENYRWLLEVERKALRKRGAGIEEELEDFDYYTDTEPTPTTKSDKCKGQPK